MAKESSKEVQELFRAKKQPVIYGSDGFKEKVKKLFSKQEVESEIPENKVLVYETEQIIRIVCKFYEIGKAELFITRRGFTNEARSMAVFLIRRLRGETLDCIANYFKIKKYSSVSSIVTRFQQSLDKDQKLRKKRDDILTMLKES